MHKKNGEKGHKKTQGYILSKILWSGGGGMAGWGEKMKMKS